MMHFNTSRSGYYNKPFIKRSRQQTARVFDGITLKMSQNRWKTKENEAKKTEKYEKMH